MLKDHEPRLICDNFLEAVAAMEGSGLASVLSDFLVPGAKPALRGLRRASGDQRKKGCKLAIRGQEQPRQEGVSEEARTTYTSCLEP